MAVRGAERSALSYVRFVPRLRRRAVGEYIELPGVRTWYEVEGQGDPVVLLHGGFCTNETWGPQRADFAADHRTFLPERRAHGHTPDVEGPLSYHDMAQDTIDFLSSVVGGPAHLVGWSDGGIVALLVANARPELVGKMTEMFRAEPDIPIEDLGRIDAPTLVLVGDDDFVPLEHTIELYRAIPNSELAVVPGTSHAHFMEKPSLVDRIVLDFLDNDPVPTMMPIRRATATGSD